MFTSDEAVEALCLAVGVDGRSGWAVFDRPDGDPDGFELRCDLSGMLGWRAPASVWAVGLIADGTARVVQEPARLPDRCRVACAVDRQGRIAAWIHREDAGTLDAPPHPGLAVDTLYRCLELPTPPPSVSVGSVLSVVWLRAVAAQARLGDAPRTWAAALALHPLWPLVRPHDDVTPGERGDEWVDRFGAGDDWLGHPGPAGEEPSSWLAELAAGLTWPAFRAALTTRILTVPSVSPDLAAWMDDGMLARWLTDGWGGEALVHDALDALPPGAERAALDVLDVSMAGSHIDPVPTDGTGPDADSGAWRDDVPPLSRAVTRRDRGRFSRPRSG